MFYNVKKLFAGIQKLTSRKTQLGACQFLK